MEQAVRKVGRILVVDDDERERVRARESVPHLDVQVAGTFEEGFDRALAENFDLIVIDLTLGTHLTGHHLAYALLEQGIDARVAVFSWAYNAPDMIPMISRMLPAKIIFRPKFAGDIEAIIHVVETGEDAFAAEFRRRPPRSFREAKRRMAREEVEKAIALYGGNKTHAAQYLQIDRWNIDRILKRGAEEDEA